MRILYLLTLINIIFCIHDLLYSLGSSDLVNSVIKEFINKTNSLPMPSNFESFIKKFDFSGVFILDIFPAENLTQEIENIGLLTGDENLKTLARLNIPRNNFLNDEDGKCLSSDSICYFKVNSHTIIKYYDGIRKRKFAIFLYYNGITLAHKKDSSNTSKKVKVCTPSNMVFKLCQEVLLEEAIKQTVKAYTYSQFKKELDSFYPKKKLNK